MPSFLDCIATSDQAEHEEQVRLLLSFKGQGEAVLISQNDARMLKKADEKILSGKDIGQGEMSPSCKDSCVWWVCPFASPDETKKGWNCPKEKE